MHTETVLKIDGVSKSFGAINALQQVNFDLRKGEIHAIAGENGAGKSTLMRVIDGILQPDSGDIYFDGQKVSIPSPAVAQKLGVGFVHQEIALCPDISVAENIFMAHTNASNSFWMNYADLQKRAIGVFEKLSNIDPATLVKDLSISHQQLVEIAKALTLDCRLLILDEPTAALTDREANVLFAIMKQLASEGISIIYISHRMAEIFEHCDRVSVFRDGQHIWTDDIENIQPGDVINAMVGRKLDSLYPEKSGVSADDCEILLEVNNAALASWFEDVSFKLRKGEIFGFAGLIGAGRSEIVKAVCKLKGDMSGEVIMGGNKLNLRNYQDSIKNGIVYLSEDRKGDGVFLDMSIASNISALALEQVSRKVGTVDRAREHKQANMLAASLNMKYGNLSDPVSSLSGGNQQKVAIAKLLSVNPKVIFLDEPTRGVDVGAKAEIHKILRDLANQGVGVLVISSELPELIGVCDRIAVVCEGRITGELVGDEMTEKNIMQLASTTH